MTPGPVLRAIARAHDLDDHYPPAVLREVDALLAAPGIDDPTLVDRRALPFVTIDNEGSRDLDQALSITRRDDGPGYSLAYALADAAHYVRPGSALFEEAVKRGASYYLPGWSIPMLPRPLSEGLISLVEGVDRRAMVWIFSLDPAGNIEDVALERARIRSRARLTYAEVQDFHDRPGGHRLGGHPWSMTLELLGEVGPLRIAEARTRHVVAARSEEVELQLDGAGHTFRVVAEARRPIDAWNEQISVMTNVEAALWLARQDSPQVQPIYRGHPPPEPSQLDELEQAIEGLVAERHLDPEIWRWRREAGECLPDYLARLPLSDAMSARRAAAIHRQAIVANRRSAYGTTVAPHHGLGARAYARVTAPMREIVGIFTHKELWELISGEGRDPASIAHDEAWRARIISAGNAAKSRQASLDKATNRVVIDGLLRPELALPPDERRRWTGTIMGLTRDKYYLRLEDPPIELKVYQRDLEPGTSPWALGDQAAVVVVGHDAKYDRWVLRGAR